MLCWFDYLGTMFGGGATNGGTFVDIEGDGGGNGVGGGVFLTPNGNSSVVLDADSNFAVIYAL